MHSDDYIIKIISDLDPHSLPDEFISEVKVRYKDGTDDIMSMPIYRILAKTNGFGKPVDDMVVKMNITKIKRAIGDEINRMIDELEVLQRAKLK